MQQWKNTSNISTLQCFRASRFFFSWKTSVKALLAVLAAGWYVSKNDINQFAIICFKWGAKLRPAFVVIWWWACCAASRTRWSKSCGIKQISKGESKYSWVSEKNLVVHYIFTGLLKFNLPTYFGLQLIYKICDIKKHKDPFSKILLRSLYHYFYWKRLLKLTLSSFLQMLQKCKTLKYWCKC